MLARKLKTVMIAVAFGLTSLGFALADDLKPVPPPPVPKAIAPPLSVPTMSGNGSKERLVERDEPCVLIEVMCLEMRAGFCQESGLMIDRPASKASEKSPTIKTVLSERETKMLKALIGIYPDRQILSYPRITLLDGQAGFIQVGSIYPVANDTDINSTDEKAGTAPPAGKISCVHVGVTCRFKPKIGKDGRSVTLAVEPEVGNVVSEGQIEGPITSVGFLGSSAKTEIKILRPGEGVEGVVFIQSSLSASFDIPAGGTAVIGGLRHSGSKGEKKTEMLLVATPRVVQPQK